MQKPKILVFDIETSPITAYTWSLWDQHVGLNQIKSDWHLLAWAAKWYGEPASKTFYADNRRAKNIQDDKELVKRLAALLDQADAVITQNGEKFDLRKLNARAIINGLPPIKPCRSTDILKEGRKVFAFTSRKLEYVSNILNAKYKKLKHEEYPGFDLWRAILSGDKRAWDVMKKYTIFDVLATEEAYEKMKGWIRTQNLATFEDGVQVRCRCGSDDLECRGYSRTETGKYQMYHCRACGKWPRSPVNLLKGGDQKHLLRETAR